MSNKVQEQVLAEQKRATGKFPTWPTDPLHALSVLGEEFGELTKAMLQHTYEPHKNVTYEDIYAEAKLISITPAAEDTIAYCARVSNPANQDKPVGKLLKYCIDHGHWSVFEMANAIVEVNTTRDIARQILRHRSFSFQEFSQRYAEPSALGTDFIASEARLQDNRNRQNSIPVDDENLQGWWDYQVWAVQQQAHAVYKEAIDKGIAKEVARKVLPEGLTMSRMYINGTIRSWITYLKVRQGNGTQAEHVEVANAISEVLAPYFPNLWKELGA